jgi:hypothetical protein
MYLYKRKILLANLITDGLTHQFMLDLTLVDLR